MPRKDTIDESIRQSILNIKDEINGIDYDFLSREYDDLPARCFRLRAMAEGLSCLVSQRNVAIALKKAGII